MADVVKVRMKVNEVVEGSVRVAGSEFLAPSAVAKTLVEEQKADYVNTPPAVKAVDEARK